MSTLNIKKRRGRWVIIRVAEVLERYPEHAAGFPGIRILDEKGREQEIAYIDCIGITEEEFSRIDPGTEIRVYLREDVSGHLEVIPKEQISSLITLKAKRPLGPSKRGLTSFGWNPIQTGRTGKTVCELCGKTHPAVPMGSDGYTLFWLFGLQGVEQCCGAAIDWLYEHFGELFAQAYMALESRE